MNNSQICKKIPEEPLDRIKYELIKLPTDRKIDYLKIKKEYKLKNITAKYIIINNIDKIYENLEEYLEPDIKYLRNYEDMKDINKATEIIISYIKNNKIKDILIVGDYDVDGIVSSTILNQYIKEITGQELDVYIPERKEGYGLTKKIVDYAINKNKKLIITVDNGIAAIEPVKYAKENGLEVIVTDHHLPGNEIPNATCVVNPQQKDCNYKDKFICGAGVTFQLVRNINRLLYGTDNIVIEHYMPLLAIATIADVVPLLLDNRLFVKIGNKMSIQNKGLLKLMKLSGIDTKNRKQNDIAFMIAPIINSAGRMGNANLAYKLLNSDNDNEIEYLANLLIEYNNMRKEVQADSFLDILNDIKKYNIDKNAGFLIYPRDENEMYNPNIVGIIASKILEIYYKPVIIVTPIIKTIYIDKEGKIIEEEEKTKLMKEYESINIGDSLIVNNLLKPEYYVKTLLEDKENINKTLNKLKQEYNILNKIKLKNGYLKLKLKSKYLKGSARSPEYFHMKNFIDLLKENNLLISGGGHKAAAGLNIRKSDIEKIQKIYNEEVCKNYQIVKKYILDIVELPSDKKENNFILREINNEIEKLAPFGPRNPVPLIAYDIGNINDIKIFGKKKQHISFRTEGNTKINCWNYLLDKEFHFNEHIGVFYLLGLEKNKFVNENGETISYFSFNFISKIRKEELI